MVVASHRLGHPWLRPKALADAVGVHNSTAWRILKRMVSNGDAAFDPDQGYRLTLRIPVTVEEWDTIANEVYKTRDLVALDCFSRTEYHSVEVARKREERQAEQVRAMQVVRQTGSSWQFKEAVRQPLGQDGKPLREPRSRADRAVARQALLRALASRDVPEPSQYHLIAEAAVRGEGREPVEAW